MAPNLSLLLADPSDKTQFAAISYPGWKRYVAEDFLPEALIRELTDKIITTVPAGPVRMIGLSLGGHFCYAIALQLRSRGREVAGVCIIDAFMVRSSAPRDGWVARALADSIDLLRKRKFREFINGVVGRFWRILLRLAGPRLPGLVRRLYVPNSGLPGNKPNSLLEFELSMRTLILAMAPWVGSIDRNPVTLESPVALLRTSQTRGDDAAWQRRCSNVRIYEIPGGHQTLFDPENIDGLRAAFAAATRDWRAS